jgi:hypothetical protein
LGTWYDPNSRTLISDLKPDNFKKDANGLLIAIDLIVHRLSDSSDIHDILSR